MTGCVRVELLRMLGPSQSTLGRYGLDDNAPTSRKGDACLFARLRNKGAHVWIIQQRRIVEREVTDHCAAPFKEPFWIAKNSASEKKEIHPARVEDDR